MIYNQTEKFSARGEAYTKKTGWDQGWAPEVPYDSGADDDT